jgi:preprotein translocase subunit SecD
MNSRIRDAYEQVKDQSTSIMQLGLDLKGGISVTIKPDFEAYAKSMADDGGNVPVLTQAEKDLALDKAMIVLNNRIDAFGLVEPQIRKTGESILVEVPGEPNFDKVNQFLGGKGSINFYLVNSTQTDALRTYIASNGASAVDDSYQIIDKTANVLQPGMKPYPVYKTNVYEEEEKTGYRVIDEANVLEGRYIKSVSAVRGSDQQPLVVFELTAKGGEIFYTLTSQNIGNELAIVMDGKIKAVATIRAALSTNVQMEGFGAEESLYLEKILKAASLPVPLTVINQEVVGATLGAEAVQTGINAGLLGFLLVVAFMLIYYKGAGFIADIALSLNVVILAALLAGFRQTITLNSIAAFVLTLGMAVDANVIIYERIKEELRLGKSAQASVAAGFGKAFWTIMDSNITTFIAALFLSFVGSGPIQGFAITLAIGIATSMFTSLFISRLLFDFFIEQIKVKKLSITWRKLA